MFNCVNFSITQTHSQRCGLWKRRHSDFFAFGICWHGNIQHNLYCEGVNCCVAVCDRARTVCGRSECCTRDMCERGSINTGVLQQEFKRVERCGRRGASVNVCPRVGAVKALMYVARCVF